MASTVILGSRRFLHPGPLRWLRALGWMVLLAVLVLNAYQWPHLGVRVLAGPVLGGAWGEILATAIGLAAMIAVYVGAVVLAERRLPREFAPRALPVDLLGGAAAGAGLQALTIAFLAIAGWASITHQPVTDWLRPIDDTIRSGFLEETVLRLVILRLVWRAFGAWPALGASALLFGLAHLGNPNATLFAAICIALEAGVLLATFYMLTGRIWASIGVHMGWNYTQGWIFGAAVSGTGMAGGPLTTSPIAGVPEWLSGGQFGPEASLPALVVCGGVGMWLLVLAWRRGNLIGIDQRPVVAAEGAPVADAPLAEAAPVVLPVAAAAAVPLAAAELPQAMYDAGSDSDTGGFSF